MKACTFFGHRDCDDDIAATLCERIENLICENEIDTFYVGNQGNFDCMVIDALRKLKLEYEHIRYYIVLAYLPSETKNLYDSENTIFPDGIENVYPRFAISFRNEWMIDKSDVVIGYIRYSFGGAYKFFEMAERKGKNTVNLFQK